MRLLKIRLLILNLLYASACRVQPRKPLMSECVKPNGKTARREYKNALIVQGIM